jgi:hypothetical protein
MHEAEHVLALASFKESLAINQRLGNTEDIIITLSCLGHETWHQGDHALGNHCSKKH